MGGGKEGRPFPEDPCVSEARVGQAGLTLAQCSLLSSALGVPPGELITGFHADCSLSWGRGASWTLRFGERVLWGPGGDHLFSPASFFKFGVEGNMIWDNNRARKRVLGKKDVFNVHPGCLSALPLVITHLVVLWPGGR